MSVSEVPVEPKLLKYLLEVLGPKDAARFTYSLKALRQSLGGREFWHVNSTAKGGGVAEMLPHLLGYMRDFGIDARWAVVGGNDDFFAVTKRLHHFLHGSKGDGMSLGVKEHATYKKVMAQNLAGLQGLIKPSDFVVLHDPQTAGLIPELKALGNPVAWRCHIGHDQNNALVELGWGFLSKYLTPADAFIFSREAYIPQSVSRKRSIMIAPSIDPHSAKNEQLSNETAKEILSTIGVIATGCKISSCVVRRYNGELVEIKRKAHLVSLGKLPSAQCPIVLQVSRWDPLKDHQGVLKGFKNLLLSGFPTEAHLFLVGPDVSSVADDPEGGRVYADVQRDWIELPDIVKSRVHLISLPMDDVQENALMVNAFQTHASIIVQKSLHEGFGLTVTEAMWKGKPMIASAVGGIQDQIEDGKSGLLLSDPKDLATFSTLLQKLLEEPKLMQKLGVAARARVKAEFLVARHIRQYGDLVGRVLLETEEPDSSREAG